jgi:hypothetical protein
LVFLFFFELILTLFFLGLRKHPKPPIEGTTATATMVIPTIKVESSLINPDDVEVSPPYAILFSLLLNLAGSLRLLQLRWIGDW